MARAEHKNLDRICIRFREQQARHCSNWLDEGAVLLACRWHQSNYNTPRSSRQLAVLVFRLVLPISSFTRICLMVLRSWAIWGNRRKGACP